MSFRVTSQSLIVLGALIGCGVLTGCTSATDDVGKDPYGDETDETVGVAEGAYCWQEAWPGKCSDFDSAGQLACDAHLAAWVDEYGYPTGEVASCYWSWTYDPGLNDWVEKCGTTGYPNDQVCECPWLEYCGTCSSHTGDGEAVCESYGEYYGGKTYTCVFLASACQRGYECGGNTCE